MPEQTYEDSKTAIDAAHRTPAIVWRLYTDNPTHAHDDVTVAECELLFDGEVFNYEIHATGYTSGYAFHAVKVKDPDESRVTITQGSRLWTDARDDLADIWERDCEYRRQVMAVEAHARYLLVNDGITLGVVNLSALSLGGPSQSVVALSPEFDSDVLAYTATTSFSNIAMLAVASPGATVTWDVGEASLVGGSGEVASVDLEAGDNVIMVTASRFEWTSTTYTITVTRS